MDEENRRAVEAMWQAVEEKDFETAAGFLDEALVEEWPQSGEVIDGRENWLSVVRKYPGFPSVTLRRVSGQGEQWFAELLFDYGQEGQSQPYHVCAWMEMRDGKIARVVEYFGAPFEPAEWRKDWVRRTRG